MLRTRRELINEGYEEFEGCYICRNKKCTREHYAAYTMNWRVVPIQKCIQHPHFFVEKALIKKVLKHE